MEDLVIINEGKVRLKVPNPSKYLRIDGVYEPAWAPVFYNPQMVLNRDLSVVALATIIERIPSSRDTVVLDALAGTGVRAIRYCIEVPGTALCIANDVDRKAAELIRENAAINNIQDKVKVFCEDANILMYKLKKERCKVDFIDIDPFGSPTPYVRASLWCVRSGGVVTYTATDTAPLSGSRWWAGSRKYDANIVKTDIGHEVGLRILLGYIARRAAELDRYVVPLLTYYDRYYYRVYVQVVKGAKRAYDMIKQDIGFLEYCPNCGYRNLVNTVEKIACPNCSTKLHLIGPLWVSPTSSKEFISHTLNRARSSGYEYLQSIEKIRSLLEKLLLEVDVPLVYNIVRISQKLKINIPKREEIIKCLIELGFKAAATHLQGNYIRTNADVKEVIYCLRSLASSRS